MTSSLFCLAAACNFLATPLLPPSPAAETVYQKLQGNWTAAGSRTFPTSKSYVAITAEAHTERVQLVSTPLAFLVSHNALHEQPYDAAGMPQAAKSYARIYWVRERQGEPGTFDLGNGDNPETGAATSVGTWDGQHFNVKQDFGGQPAYKIDSVTDFTNQDQPSYLEKFWHGPTQLAETALQYLRTAGP